MMPAQSHNTLNQEIDKVREESRYKLHDMRAFYEKELTDMRTEFEVRENSIKYKMEEKL
jgi:hypothetical protein